MLFSSFIYSWPWHKFWICCRERAYCLVLFDIIFFWMMIVFCSLLNFSRTVLHNTWWSGNKERKFWCTKVQLLTLALWKEELQTDCKTQNWQLYVNSLISRTCACIWAFSLSRCHCFIWSSRKRLKLFLCMSLSIWRWRYSSTYS
jgi:hypothetical protein